MHNVQPRMQSNPDIHCKHGLCNACDNLYAGPLQWVALLIHIQIVPSLFLLISVCVLSPCLENNSSYAKPQLLCMLQLTEAEYMERLDGVAAALRYVLHDLCCGITKQIVLSQSPL